MYEIFLGAQGNPDHNENPYLPIVNGIEIESHWEEGKTIDEVVSKAQKFIDENGIGAGNWIGGLIVKDNRTNTVGYMSYNGRVWADKK